MSNPISGFKPDRALPQTSTSARSDEPSKADTKSTPKPVLPATFQQDSRVDAAARVLANEPAEALENYQALMKATSGRDPLAGAQTLKRVAAPGLDLDLTAEQISARLAKAMKKCDQRLKAIVALPDDQRTFANTMLALEEATNDFSDVAMRLGFLKDVHLDDAVREASAKAEEDAGKYNVQLMARRDVFQALKAWAEGPGRDEPLDATQKRLADETIRAFRRNGMDLPDDKLAELVQIRSRLTELNTAFGSNLNENKDKVEFDAKSVAGVPESFLKGLERSASGAYIVPVKTNPYVVFMENCTDAEARKKLYFAYNNREAAKNTPLLQEAVRLRDQAAKLLGFATHTDYVVEDRMAKNAATVKEFLGDLRVKLQPRLQSDVARLTEAKRADTKDPSAKLEPWDIAFYFDKLRKRDLSIDNEKLKEYFPAEQVVDGMFRLCEDLFSIKISETKGAKTWHPSAKRYEIRDRDSGELLGQFYADLFMRKEPGKYGHAAMFPLGQGRETKGEYRAPLCALVTNFETPTADKPSLLSFDEVTTLFHEFGHTLHQTLTTARWGSMSGANTVWDFVEAPSQILENWCYEPKVLERIAGHYQDPSKKLPAETVEKLDKLRTFDAGWHYSRQVYLGTFDQKMHTSGGQVDPDQIARETFEQVLGMPQLPGIHFPATFGHMMGGYEGGYYSYLWAEVFADDMFGHIKANGVLNPEIGRAYRDVILAHGRMEDADVLLERFLGRKPSNAAFLAKLGVN